eukprot:COSAG03_NODE_1860_length_3422_cov_4.368643_5_plen_132_part_00
MHFSRAFPRRHKRVQQPSAVAYAVAHAVAYAVALDNSGITGACAVIFCSRAVGSCDRSILLLGFLSGIAVSASTESAVCDGLTLGCLRGLTTTAVSSTVASGRPTSKSPRPNKKQRTTSKPRVSFFSFPLP